MFSTTEKMLLQDLYSESRGFEDFGDKVCFAMMHNDIPEVDTINITMGGICIVQTDRETISFSPEDASWSSDIRKDMSIDIPKEMELIQQAMDYMTQRKE